MGLSSNSTRQSTTSSGTTSGTSANTIAGNTASNTTNTYERLPGAESEDIARLRNQQFEVDPGLASQYGRQRADLNKSFAQPLGGHLSRQVRDAQMRSGNERLGRDEAEALRKGQYDKNQLEFGRNSTVAGLTAPPLVQTGSSSTGSTTGTSTGSNTGNTTGNSSGTMTQTPSAMSTITGVGAALAPLSL